MAEARFNARLIGEQGDRQAACAWRLHGVGMARHQACAPNWCKALCVAAPLWVCAHPRRCIDTTHASLPKRFLPGHNLPFFELITVRIHIDAGWRQERAQGVGSGAGKIVSGSQSVSQEFEQLYGNHHHWLLAWVNWRLGNAADAADLAHDAFVRLLTRPCHFDDAKQARTYLRKMANGMCVDLWRRRTLEQAWLEELAAQPEPTASSAEQQAMVLEALGEIDAMLRDLPPKAAHAFVMAVACEMTDDEVAAVLKVSSRMVRKYVAQAMLCCMKLEARLAAGGADMALA